MTNQILFELVSKYGSPLYVYDEAILLDRCKQMADFARKLEAGLPNGISVQMHYSQKANCNPAILKIVKDSGLAIDCMSPYELALALKVFDDPSPRTTLYVCNNITAEEMQTVYGTGVLICLDSIDQVETWGKLYPSTEIMVRINPGTSGVGHSKSVVTSGKDTKFGISEQNLWLLFDVAKRHNLKIVGSHQHLGSLFLNDKIDDFIAGVEAGLDTVKRHFNNLEIIDLGGGFGVPYKPEEAPLDLDLVAGKLLPILSKFVADYPSVKSFKFEPGRFIPCEAGSLVGLVTANKYEHDKHWIGTDIGMNQLVRPSMYGAYHQIEIIPTPWEHEGVNFCANIVGNVCESGDILGKDRALDFIPQVNDLVVVRNAGAYGYSMASVYTGRPRPAEVLCKDVDSFTPTFQFKHTITTHRLIRKRENLLDNIIW